MASDSIVHRQRILEECVGRPASGLTLLDFGCGAGDDVVDWRKCGYVAYGCDVKRYADTEACVSLYADGTLRLIEAAPYRIPFDDASFDVVVSNQVFEHVQDYPTAIDEIDRVLKPGGVSLHVFPPRWLPIEAHVWVPLAGVLQGLAWLRLWAATGIRNEFQAGLSATEVARLNVDYLREHTNYLSTQELREQFGRRFHSVRFIEDIYLRHSTSRRARALAPWVARVPLLRHAFSCLRQRVVLAKKAHATPARAT